jgi:hypothetical protein
MFDEFSPQLHQIIGLTVVKQETYESWNSNILKSDIQFPHITAIVLLALEIYRC